MTAQKEFKNRVRARQRKTAESYTAARAHLLRARDERFGRREDPTTPVPEQRVEAIVLKVGQQTVRARIPSENVQVTFRSTDAWDVVPGHMVTLVVSKRWTWRGNPYASGRIEDPRIDASKLGLSPLPLHVFDLASDLRSAYEPFRSPDPYAPLWRKLTAKPRDAYDFDPIAWGTFPDEAHPGDNPTCDAAELLEVGDVEGARTLLMDTLLRDLRCLDAHALLGNIEFERAPECALLHFEIGVRIGDLSLPPGFDGVLLWGRHDNRPFLRCLHGYGLCLWRLGRAQEALGVFERGLSLNPNDNQGIRFCRQDVLDGRSWEEAKE